MRLLELMLWILTPGFVNGYADGQVATVRRQRRLVEARAAVVVEVPHHVSLQLCESAAPTGQRSDLRENGCYKMGRHICSGFIYDNKTVLTAGWCTLYTKKFGKTHTLFAVVGISSLVEANGSYHKVISTRKHPLDPTEFKKYGIAMLKVEPEFEWSRGVQPAEAGYINPALHRTCVVSGYGCNHKINYPETTCNLTRRLSVVKVQMSMQIPCYGIVKTIGIFTDSEHFVCFNLHNISSGDIGNPLTCNDVVVGLATHTSLAVEHRDADVYINLNRHYRFLHGISGQNDKRSNTIIISALSLIICILLC